MSRPDPDRRVKNVWRIESHSPDQPDQMDYWDYVTETAYGWRVPSMLKELRGSKRAKRLGLAFRARRLETKSFIEDW